MINIIEWSNILKNCDYDKKVGIKIAKIAGNNLFSTFITEIDQNKFVNPHYHNNGEEHYHIISGEGEMIFKNILTNKKQSLIIKAQESFVVPDKTLHQLINIGNSPLILMFSCPLSHLTDDRHFL